MTLIILILIILGLLNLYFGWFHARQYQLNKIKTSGRIGLKKLQDIFQNTTDEIERVRLLKIIKLYKVYLGLWFIEIFLIIYTIAKAAP